MKYLLITEQKNNYFFSYINDNNIDICKTYCIDNVIEKYELKLKKKLGLDYKKFLSSNIKGKYYDMIVYFDISCDYKNLPLLKGTNSDVRLFIWNIVDDFIGRLKKENTQVTIEYVKKCFDKVYSFDKKDCEKYGLEYFPQLYSDQIKLDKTFEIENDVIFLGSEKGRYSKLYDIYQNLEQFGLKQKYHIYQRDAELADSDGFTITSKKIAYQDYLKWLSRSKAILDIPQDGQSGFTMRIMEAVFLRKKLITTYRGIKEYSIYNPQNIFIIGVDDYSQMKNFLESEYVEYEKEILQFYECRTWLKNMKENCIIQRGV